MKNRKLFISLFLLTSQHVFCQLDTVSLNSLNLKGKVSKMTELTFSAIDSAGIIVKGNYLHENYEFKIDSILYKNNTNCKLEFDKDGKRILKGIYNDYCYLYDITKYKYLNKQLREFNEISEYSDGTIYIKNICKYDNNNLISISTYRNDKLLYKKVYKYDEQNNIIEEASLENNGNITGKISRRYAGKKLVYEKKIDENNKTEKIYKYDSSGKVVYSMSQYDDLKFETKYEYSHNLPTAEYSSRNGKPDVISNYEYIDGKIAKTILKYPNDSAIIFVEEIKYQLNNITEIIRKEGNQTSKQVFDNNKNIIKLQIINNSDIEEFTYEYLYDKNENWTRIIEYKNTIPLKIRERRIEYFTPTTTISSQQKSKRHR